MCCQEFFIMSTILIAIPGNILLFEPLKTKISFLPMNLIGRPMAAVPGKNIDAKKIIKNRYGKKTSRRLALPCPKKTGPSLALPDRKSAW
jgi:hypothetical protein